MVIKGYRTKVKPTAQVLELKRILELWRETGIGMIQVKSSDVVPDSSNRSHTGLSIDHVHFIASSILKKGFRAREGDVKTRSKMQPHDIPVLVRGSSTCPIAQDSLHFWRASVEKEPRFPKIVVNESNFFTSLGNGHFTQALNLFRHQQLSKFTGKPFVSPAPPAPSFKIVFFSFIRIDAHLFYLRVCFNKGIRILLCSPPSFKQGVQIVMLTIPKNRKMRSPFM